MSIDTVAYIGEAIGQEGPLLCQVPQRASVWMGRSPYRSSSDIAYPGDTSSPAFRNASCPPSAFAPAGGPAVARAYPSGHIQRATYASGVAALSELIAAGAPPFSSGVRRSLHDDPSHLGTLAATLQEGA